MDVYKVGELELRIAQIISSLGLDLNDPNLKDTPQRIQKMMKEELFSSIGKELPQDCTAVFKNEGYDEIIMLDNIPFTSMCAHHFLPFSGLAYLLYIPKYSIIGASKPARMIEFYCKKPQIQEQLGIDIMNGFISIVQPLGAMLVMRATHSCMSCRGAKTGLNAGMTTCITRGTFRNNQELEMKGLQLIQIFKEK